MRDVRVLAMMGGVLLLTWLLAPASPRPLSTASAAPKPRRGQPEPTEPLRPIEIDESFTPRRLLH